MCTDIGEMFSIFHTCSLRSLATENCHTCFLESERRPLTKRDVRAIFTGVREIFYFSVGLHALYKLLETDNAVLERVWWPLKPGSTGLWM